MNCLFSSLFSTWPASSWAYWGHLCSVSVGRCLLFAGREATPKHTQETLMLIYWHCTTISQMVLGALAQTNLSAQRANGHSGIPLLTFVNGGKMKQKSWLIFLLKRYYRQHLERSSLTRLFNLPVTFCILKYPRDNEQTLLPIPQMLCFT